VRQPIKGFGATPALDLKTEPAGTLESRKKLAENTGVKEL